MLLIPAALLFNPQAPAGNLLLIRTPVGMGDRPARQAQERVGCIRNGMGNGATVNSLQNSADATVRRFLRGEGGELHQVALEQQQAQLSFDLFLQMRNKAVQAYQEVMRMQL